ncbi:ATP-binding protein [Pseudotenacibaculum haliotis]|uniref:ATP-binding protein n=1 Tax=Pseudotenacibaculum haliotis TaxID=1862138 RepID=A0ABW5LRW0_9FLAO
MNEVTKEYKLRIVQSINENAFKFTTNKAHAVSIGIDPAQYSRVLAGETEGVLSDKKWMLIASKYNVPATADEFVWKAARNTAVYKYIYKQLESCQRMSISGIFCDIADIGKTFTARDYVKEHRNAILIDCSLHKSRTQFLRAMAKEWGIDHQIPLRILRNDLIQYMNSMTTPIVVCDEFGDLNYPAFLEVKSLWNATEYRTAWYMMGADGLSAKLDRNKANKKVGYAEIFSRLGSKYQRITPIGEQERKKFLLHEIARILKANESKYTPLEMYAKTFGSLRRVFFEIKKEKTITTTQNE